MKQKANTVLVCAPPAPLFVQGSPESQFFPERIILLQDLESPFVPYAKKAVFVPDTSSLGPGEEWDIYRMWYLSISDPNSEILLEASLLGNWFDATKFFRGQAVTSVCRGEQWESFFSKVVRLPIHPEERCIALGFP